MEDPTLREMAEYVEANRDEIWEKVPGNRQVTLLVFREGDQLNFFRVVDRGDGTLTPLSESLRYCNKNLGSFKVPDITCHITDSISQSKLLVSWIMLHVILNQFSHLTDLGKIYLV